MAEKKPYWIRPRHLFFTRLVQLVIPPYLRLAYGWKCPRAKDRIRGQYLVLLNHVTPMDQFFIGGMFQDPIYYVATEDIFSNGLLSRLISWVIAPIPIRKQTTDPKAVMTCLKVARAGGSICIAPEGNRSYSGKTEYMNPAIAALARKLKLPIALVAIEGGYGKEPRWSDTIRSGKLDVKLRRIISPEEAAAMDSDTLLEAIREGITVNEAVQGPEYRGKHQAEYLERAVYICPKCGITHFESHGDKIACLTCGAETRYNPDKTLTGLNWDCPFPFINDWYEYQKDYVNAYMPQLPEPICQDTVDLYRVHLYKNKEKLHLSIPLTLYADRLVLGELVIPMEEISTLTVLGKNKLNIYFNDGLYQIKGGKRFNALKYVQLYFRIHNIARGDINGQFLGL